MVYFTHDARMGARILREPRMLVQFPLRLLLAFSNTLLCKIHGVSSGLGAVCLSKKESSSKVYAGKLASPYLKELSNVSRWQGYEEKTS